MSLLFIDCQIIQKLNNVNCCNVNMHISQALQVLILLAFEIFRNYVVLAFWGELFENLMKYLEL